MPWDQRGSKRYFYVSERRAGKPRRRYIGTASNPDAILAATAADLARVQREITIRERGQRKETETQVVSFCDLTEFLARAALVAAGYHRHERGAWRRRRVRKGDDGERGPADSGEAGRPVEEG